MLQYMHQQGSATRAGSYRRFVSRCWRNCPSWLHARTSRLGSQSMWITRLIASNRIAFLAFECCTFLDFGGSCDLLSIVSIHSVSLDRTVGSSETFATWVNMTMGHFTFWLSPWPSLLAEPEMSQGVKFFIWSQPRLSPNLWLSQPELSLWLSSSVKITLLFVRIWPIYDVIREQPYF